MELLFHPAKADFINCILFASTKVRARVLNPSVTYLTFLELCQADYI